MHSSHLSATRRRKATAPSRHHSRHSHLRHFGLATLLVAAALIAPGRAHALFVQELEVTCPIDGKPFRARMVAAFSSSGMRLDLKPLGSVVAPYPYPVCPDNGFVMYKSDFSEAELAAIRPIVQSDEYQRLRREHTSYYMMGYLKERMGVRGFELAEAYLGASWEAERDKPHLVADYRARARDKFDAFLAQRSGSAEGVQSEEWWTASAVAAELERLLGHFDKAAERVNGLPVSGLIETMGQKGDLLTQLVDQIRLRALAHDAQPATISDLVGQRT
jgi:hypothetical protein